MACNYCYVALTYVDLAAVGGVAAKQTISRVNNRQLNVRAEASTDDLAVEVIGDGPHMLSAVDAEVKEAAIALAQLSVARQGEYLGTGSMVCELHRVRTSYFTRSFSPHAIYS